MVKNYSLSRVSCSLISDNCLSLSELDDHDSLIFLFTLHSPFPNPTVTTNPQQLQVKTIVAFAFHRNDTSLQEKHSRNTLQHAHKNEMGNHPSLPSLP